MIQTFGTTENFVIKYEDTNFATTPPTPFLHSKRRAEELMATCESDFYVLKSWFGATDGFGSANRTTLQVEPANLASNNGYRTDGSSLIRMDPLDGAAVQAEGDDAVQSLFVAEMIEILMGYRNHKTGVTSWHANKSDGEGLSRVAAATLHPVGYYRLLGGPFVNMWLTQKRTEDWVSVNDDSDTVQSSYGCAIVFLYYLRDQLQHSLGDIIRHGGDTLEATYHNLTGSTGGYAAMMGLLDRYLPYVAGDPTRQMNNLAGDNPFPIWEGNNRRVGLQFSESTVSRLVPFSRFSQTVTVRPFFTCPEGTYRYHRRSLNSTLTCVAATDGFAQPIFSWKVNGQHTYSGGSITPTVPISVDRADHPGEPITAPGAAHIHWGAETDASTFDEVQGQLIISNSADNHLGHEHLTVEVTVREAFGSDDSITIPGWPVLDTADIAYEDQFYIDRVRCAARFWEQVAHYELRDIRKVFRVPEPDPPVEIMQGIRTLRGVADELARVSTADRSLGSVLTAQLARSLELPAEVFSVLATAPRPDKETSAAL